MRQDSDSSAALPRPLLPDLYRLAFRLTGTRDDAQDLVQDVVVKVLSRNHDLTALDNPGMWLARVLYNHFVDDRRRYGRSPLKLVSAADPDELDLGGASPEAAAQHSQTSAALTRALDRLPENQRLVVLLHDSEGYTLEEIQRIADVPLGTLKSRLHRGRTRLAELLPGLSEKKPKKDGTLSAPASCKSVEGVKRDVV